MRSPIAKLCATSRSRKDCLSAREAIASYYAERGVQISPDDLILTTSTSEAYSFVFRLLCDPGDAVLVPTPSYPLFDFLAEIQDVKLVPYELVYDHGWQVDLTSLARGIERADAHCARGASCASQQSHGLVRLPAAACPWSGRTAACAPPLASDPRVPAER